MARSTSRSWPRLLSTDTVLGQRLRLRTVVAVLFSSRGARRARASPRGEPADRPQSICLCALRAWRGCLRGQLVARSTLRSWPRLLSTDTALGQRLRLRTVVAVSFSSRGARRARASPRGEPADRPQSTCLCALRAWRGCLRSQLAARSTPRRWPRLLCAGTIERTCRNGATLKPMKRWCRAREAGASPQDRWVCCSPIDGGHTRSSHDCHCSASKRCRHGWSTASVRRHGTIERARWDGAALDTIRRRCRAREAGASPQARWVCCSPIDEGTTRFARDCQCSASARWSHGWSAASVRRHGTIERPRWDGTTLDTMKRRFRRP